MLPKDLVQSFPSFLLEIVLKTNIFLSPNLKHEILLMNSFKKTVKWLMCRSLLEFDHNTLGSVPLH